ncbi:hypothetical protein ACPJHQ_21255 [Rossellomorea sp. H39__3]
MQRRTSDSFGNRGKVESLQAQPKRLNCLPAGKAADRSETERSYYYHSLLQQQKQKTELNTKPPHPSSKSAVQQRTADSHGNRGKVETLEASAEAAQLPPSRKAAGRSETERCLTITHQPKHASSLHSHEQNKNRTLRGKSPIFI